MNKNLVNWKPVWAKSKYGKDILIQTPECVDRRVRRTLLSRILAMPKKKPISFEAAIAMLDEKTLEPFLTGNFEGAVDKHMWYMKNFVRWVSSLGYHIELSGDEFETFSISDKLI